ncbi:YkoF family thiamine/hydroxymethylpyrimidine-binding protein [Georgenia halophila]|uniref:YkoF family thiamine/hydroxymethylpyrimidine-binding protein n=1 Tax=Georgenia halophila TaxID=620889 RepID=A0ABP8LIE0_9MICO
MSTSTTRPNPSTDAAGASPAELGVGMRFSIHPHTDRFVDVILGALADVEEAGLTDGLTTETDEVSTYVGATTAPAEQRLAAYLSAVIAAASRRSGGGHVVVHVLLSRGCPGETTCDLSVTGLPDAEPIELEPTGITAAAQWSLYPLLDAGGPASASNNGDDNGNASSGDHMAHIESAIAAAHGRGTAATPAHYATKLTGDIAEVLATAVDAWAQVGAHVPHVVTHLTISVGSPTQSEG